MLKKIICMAIMTYCSVKAAFAPSLRYPLPAVINKITNANATCDSGNLNITVFMQQPFKGLLFAKDFSQECRSLGTLTNTLTLHLPTSGCGVRLISETNSGSEDIFYTVTLVIQQDRHLRQVTDQEYNIRCRLQNNAMVVRSQPMADAFKNILTGKKSSDSRTARMKEEGWSKESAESSSSDLGHELTEALSAARAWMEIVPEQDSGHSGTLQVGEPTLLMVKSTLPG
ncbi:hypothetical protein ILUMI_22786 [Ignelater luminosus]|uniref:ZP domain-containing protein n=1 Tax=Ignelater luminosus TaxID=2038154 RepID=A0A8K0C9Z2_IGNLU|nr:hypothetical protein ILUMI_22786 [Ignelater luminosus]